MALKEVLETDMFRKIIRGVILEDALKLSIDDNELFKMKLAELCKDVLFEWEGGAFDIQYEISSEMLVLFTPRGDPIFRYVHWLHEYPSFLNRLSHRPIAVKASMGSICWLGANQSPIDNLNIDAWYHIAKFMDIDSLRSMSCVSTRYNDMLKCDPFWRPYYTIIKKKVNTELYGPLKERVLNYLLYHDSDKQLQKLLFTEIGQLFAKFMFLGYFVYQFDRFCVVETKRGAREARLAIGYRTPEGMIRANLWIDVDWKLWYASETDTPTIMQMIERDIVGYRRRLMTL